MGIAFYLLNQQISQEFAKLSRHRVGPSEYTDTLGLRANSAYVSP